VRRSHLFAILAVSCLAIGAVVSIASAQRSPAGPTVAPSGGGTAVALLDINHIFKSHSRFQAMKESMKSDVAQAEAQVKKEKETIRSLAERLKDFKPGTPDYNQLEQEIVSRRADLEVLVQRHRREFLQNEAKIYHNVYKEILQEVEYFATNHNIGIVLRFSGEPVDTDNPEAVLRDINKSVIWFSGGLDITQEVLNRLNARAAPRVGQPTRQGVPYRR